MKKVPFSKVQVGQKFKYAPSAEIALIRVEPRPHGMEGRGACPRCGEPRETWVNNETEDKHQGGHTCPERLVYLLESETPEATASQSLERTQQEIQQTLQDRGLSYQTQPNGQLWVRQGSTVVTVSASHWNKRMLIILAAPVALNVKKVTPELMQRLLQKNGQMMLGAYFMSGDGTSIWFGHAIFGEPLHKDNLLVALVTVGMIADREDDELAELTGGQRAADVWFR